MKKGYPKLGGHYMGGPYLYLVKGMPWTRRQAGSRENEAQRGFTSQPVDMTKRPATSRRRARETDIAIARKTLNPVCQLQHEQQ